MFDIISYGGGNLLFQILQGVAMFFGSSDYLFTMKIVATMAAVAILVQCAFSGRMPDMKWLLVIIFMYMFAFVPKVTVTITDTVERAPGFPTSTATVRTVANVPIGLAFIGAFTSHMKDYFVKGMETVFSLPGEMSYRTAGPLFAQGIAEKSLETGPKTPSTVASLSNFWRDCVFYDVALGFYSMDDLAKADDLEDFLRTNVNSNRFYQHVATSGAQSFVGCRASLQSGGALKVALDAEKQQQAQWVSWVNNLGTKPSPSANNTLMTSGAAAMPVAMAYMTGMSVTSSRLLGQTILSNSFANGLTSFASQAEAQEVMQGYAAAKAEAERSVTFGTLGKISGRMLPLMNIIAEALIYAVFPIVALFVLWPGGHKAAGAYAMALLWISLWAPLYAVMHYFSAFFTSIAVGSAGQICDAANSCAPHLNMYTMRSMKEAFANAAAISGFFCAMVPYVAYMLVSKSGAMMAGTVGRLMDGYSQPISHAASEASAGNVSMGAMNYENQTAFQHNTAPSQTSGHLTSNDGLMRRTENSHGAIAQQNMSNIAINSGVTQAAQASAGQAVERATQKVEQTTTNLAEARAAEFRETFSHGTQGSHQLTSGSGTDQSQTAARSEAVEHLKSAASSYAQSHNFTDSQTRSMLVALESKLSAGISTPIGGVSGGVSSSVSGGVALTDQKSESAANQFLASDAAKEVMQSVTSFGNSDKSGDTRTATTTDGHDKAAAHSNTVKAEHAQQAALQELESAKQTSQYVESTTANLSASTSGAIVERLEGLLGQGRAAKGLSDVEHGVDSEEATLVKREAFNYFVENKPENLVDAGGTAAELRSQSEREQGDLQDEGRADVNAKARADVSRVGQQNLHGQGVSQHGAFQEAAEQGHAGQKATGSADFDNTTTAVVDGSAQGGNSISAPTKVEPDKSAAERLWEGVRKQKNPEPDQ